MTVRITIGTSGLQPDERFVRDLIERINAMVTQVSPALLTDAQRVLNEVRKRPTGYRRLKDILGGDSVRVLRAIDRLKALGVIDCCMIGGNTHFRVKH